MTSFNYSEDANIVRTDKGMIRGFERNGIYTFHGIKYADAKRFQMPEPVREWKGVKDATSYGFVCPVNGNPMPMGELYMPHRFWPANEHCQYLNIWTQTINKPVKKPVMVWLHGGGFSDGSSIEQIAYEGDSLARFGDVVVVTLNHRLNILGYLDMSSFGDKYQNSGNAGMADIVEALRWIHNNIEGFGGDPDNVMIFGQSGGGRKVCALLQIPEAAGLFHKAGMMSGIDSCERNSSTDHRPFIEGMLKELNIPLCEVERLEKVPYHSLICAFNRTAVKLEGEVKVLNWEPVANDWYLGDAREVGFSDYAKKVPTMAGSVFAEIAGHAHSELKVSDSEKKKIETIRSEYGANTDKVIELFRKAYPDKDLTRLLKVDRLYRLFTTKYIEEKAKVSEVPSYLYNFAPEFDIADGSCAWHCSDIPFVFHNTDKVPGCNIEGITERLEQEVAGAWVSFAYYGNPDHAGMMKWQPYTEVHRTTMIFDRESAGRDNYDRELLEFIEEALPPFTYAMPKNVNEDGEVSMEWIY